MQAGGLLFVSGTDALDGDGALVAATTSWPRRGRPSPTAAGAAFADVVKVTVYLTDVDDRAVDELRRELFGAARPASTLAEISRLALPGARIEVDAVAVVD